MGRLDGKVVVITGGAHGIGLCAADEFKKMGAYVCVIDCTKGDHYVGDISSKETLEDFAGTLHPHAALEALHPHAALEALTSEAAHT